MSVAAETCPFFTSAHSTVSVFWLGRRKQMTGGNEMGIKLDMVGIVERDMKASLDFYRVLGLDIPEEANGQPHVEVAQNGFRLAFDTQEIIKDVYGGWEEPAGHRIELAFLYKNMISG
jgi:hypothetical protein